MRKPAAISAAAIAALLGPVCSSVACGDDSVTTRLTRVGAILRGTVDDPNDRPVPGAEIFVVVNQNPTCDDKDAGGGVADTTDVDGIYFARLGMPLTPPFQACLEVRAKPPEGSGLKSKTVSGVLVDFVREGEVPDTALVDIVLPPG